MLAPILVRQRTNWSPQHGVLACASRPACRAHGALRLPRRAASVLLTERGGSRGGRMDFEKLFRLFDRDNNGARPRQACRLSEALTARLGVSQAFFSFFQESLNIKL